MHRHFQIAALSLALAAGGGCSKENPPPRAGPTASGAVPEVARMTPDEFAESLPKVGGVEGYAGSASCRECHEEQFASWHRSYHRTMTQFAASNTVQAKFEGVVLTNENTRFRLSNKGGEYWVRLEHIDSEQSAATEVRLALITGSHHMQVFWLAEGHGNFQIGFPFTWLIPEQRWVPRNSTFIRPPEMQHRPEGWNVVCSRCHTTGVEPHANMAARVVETRAAELGISCEACHGPGKKHVEVETAARGKTALEEHAIVHPKKIDPVRSGQVCGFCHSMKWIPESANWRARGFTFRPGDDLNASTQVIRASNLDDIPGLKEHLSRNPEILDDFFWPDGMIRVSGREYNGLIESPCYKGGKFSCVTCHSLHDSDPDDQLSARAKGNGACLQCHENLRESASLTAHTRHSADSSGSECYNCHMPHTTYGVLKAIRSHQISSPRVTEELATGRPNACNLCHLDKSLQWTTDRLSEWYRQAKFEVPDAAKNTARIPALALLGDAGQRSLAAWHLSWPPALEVSGTNWIAPLLGQLLDDPYAAVRCVAERSLNAVSPELRPVGYDFTTDPRSRKSAREDVWSVWSRRDGAEAALEKMNMGTNRLSGIGAFDQLVQNRDERRVRLRE